MVHNDGASLLAFKCKGRPWYIGRKEREDSVKGYLKDREKYRFVLLCQADHGQVGSQQTAVDGHPYVLGLCGIFHKRKRSNIRIL